MRSSAPSQLDIPMTTNQREDLICWLANNLTLLQPGDLRDSLPACTDEQLRFLQTVTQRGQMARQMTRDADPIRGLLRKVRAEQEGLP